MKFYLTHNEWYPVLQIETTTDTFGLGAKEFTEEEVVKIAAAEKVLQEAQRIILSKHNQSDSWVKTFHITDFSLIDGDVTGIK